MDSMKVYELSNPQKRIWLTELLNDRKDMSNIGYLIEFKGEYDLERLVLAIKHVVKANRGLQLRFRYADKGRGELEQYLPADDEAVTVKIIEAANEHEMLEEIEKLHRQQFAVEDRYHCAFAVFSIEKKRFGFFEKANHLVADGISALVVAREVMNTYRQLTAGDFSGQKKELSYTDFLEDEQEYIGSEKYNRSKEHWRERFADYQGEDITFETKNKQNSLRVARGSYRIPRHIIPALEEYKANQRAVNFTLFMAALAIYFNRFFGHDDMVIGMPVHNRAKKIFRDMVGMFVSTIPFRIKFDEQWGFNDLLAYVKKQLWEDLKHQGYPFNHLANDFKNLNLDASGFLNVQLIELPGADEEWIEKRAFYSTQYNISQLSFYLNQQISKQLQDLEIALDYHEDIFEKREVDALFKRLAVILGQAVKEPERRLSELTLLEEAETNELVHELNATEAEFPKEKTLAHLFAEQVAKNPQHIALEYEDETVTYSELDQVTDKLAAKLQGCGAAADAIVGILCERSIEAVLSILAILKAGGAYLPIDPAFPLERKKYIVDDSGLSVLLIEKVLAEQESEWIADNREIEAVVVDYRTLKEEPAGRAFDSAAVKASSENLAYVIYTSGTTGNPKGTLLRQRNVINYICWGAGFYVKGQTLAFPLYTSLSFDLTVTSIFIPLITGSKIVIYRDSKEGLLIERVVKENRVDIVKLTPSHLKVIKELKCQDSRIQSFIVGGEELKTETAREIDDYFAGNINIYNEYGPTETAVGCMIHRYDKERDFDVGVPIGIPSNNVKIYILDKKMRPLPLGIVGEIYIAGAGVAAGYLKNDALTAEKFVDNPFIPGQKMYRSGDLGRWNLDKILEFYGRCDEQVKIRGYRIEPGEIEKQLAGIAGIKDAVVVVVPDHTGQDALCAYMVPEEPVPPGEAEPDWLQAKNIRKKLAENLPDYMVPAFFVTLEKIPLTHNGKLDKKALPLPQRKAETEADQEPTSDVERSLRKIWADVLAVEGVGRQENFYELGGDSIKAVQISARMNELDLSVNAQDILKHQTIDQLLLHVDFHKERKTYEQGLMEGEKRPAPIESWFFANDFKNPHYFNQSVLLEFAKDIDPQIVKKCFALLIAHHDGLRLNADQKKHTLYYNNRHLEGDIEIEAYDIPEDNWLEKIAGIGAKVKSSFDIHAALLIKAAVIRCAVDKKQHLLITAHHLVIDGVSWRILLEDLYNLYRALSTGKQGALPTLHKKSASLTDWVVHQLEYAQTEACTRQVPYWQEVMASDFTITGDSTGTAGTIKEREKVGFTLDQDQTETLASGSRRVFNSDIEVLLVTALAIALHDFTGKKEIVIELENHGRVLEDIDLSRTIGWLTAMFPMRIVMDKDDLTGRIKSTKEQLAKVPDRGIGWGILKYLVDQIPEDYKSQVRFNYLGQFDQEITNDIFSYSDIDTGADIAAANALSTPIEINCMILRGRLVFDLLYDTKALTKETIDRLLEKIETTLQEMAEYLKTEDDVHFTPSDFDTVDLDEDDLEALFS